MILQPRSSASETVRPKNASVFQQFFRAGREANNPSPCNKNICNVQRGCSTFTCDESDRRDNATPWITLLVQSSLPKWQTQAAHPSVPPAAQLSSPSPGRGYSIGERAGHESQQEGRFSKISQLLHTNDCLRLLQKQFITQAFLLIAMWIQFPWESSFTLRRRARGKKKNEIRLRASPPSQLLYSNICHCANLIFLFGWRLCLAGFFPDRRNDMTADKPCSGPAAPAQRRLSWAQTAGSQDGMPRNAHMSHAASYCSLPATSSGTEKKRLPFFGGSLCGYVCANFVTNSAKNVKIL